MRLTCYELGPLQATGMLAVAAVLLLVAVALPPLMLAVVLSLGLLPALAAVRLDASSGSCRTASPAPRALHARAPPRS